MQRREVENRHGIQGLCGWNDDLEIGPRVWKESYGIGFPDAELSSGMAVGKQLKVKLGMRKRLVSERRSNWRQEKGRYTDGKQRR
jgi:hypothetical protein